MLSRSLDTTIIAQVKLSLTIIFCGEAKKIKKSKKGVDKWVTPCYIISVLDGLPDSNRDGQASGRRKNARKYD